MAKGARKTKSLLLAGTQFLCFAEYMLYKGGNMYSMNSCETIEVFYDLRIDLDKLKYASYATKIVNDVTTENQNSYKVLQLFLNTLHMMSSTDKDLEFITSVFRLRLLSIIGFKPIVERCQNCSITENLKHFSFKESGFKCEACGKQDKSSMTIAETTKDAIKYVVLADPKQIYSFEISEDSEKELEIVSKIYLTEKLEKEFKI